MVLTLKMMFIVLDSVVMPGIFFYVFSESNKLCFKGFAWERELIVVLGNVECSLNLR